MTKSDKDPYRFAEKTDNPKWESDLRVDQERFASQSGLSEVEKFRNFPLFASRQTITRFLAKHELFKMVLDVPGSVFECGVLFGGGLFSFAHFSAIFEPVNAQRRIVGFDTFSGFPEIHEKDKQQGRLSSLMENGEFCSESFDLINQGISLFDRNRFLSHLPKIELVQGDVAQTVPRYIEDHPHTLVSLLYLDMDIYIGTKAAMEACLPRMPEGAIIAFDEFACERWPGETIAAMEALGIRDRKFRRFSSDSYISYVVL